MSRQWYPHYSGDYMRQTGHLSLVEDGAYRRLLDHYYSSGKPVPANAEQLHRICRAVAQSEQSAVDRVAKEFFIKKNGNLHNRRADKELEKAGEISVKRSNAAKKMHDAKAHANADAKAHTATATATTTAKKPQPLRFRPPTIVAVSEFMENLMESQDCRIEAEKFVDHFTSNGWLVGGKAKMKDWKAAARNWARRNAPEPERKSLL